MANSRAKLVFDAKHRRGAAVMELALLTPIVFMLTMGAFELGRGLWTRHVLTNAAREAARYASVRSIKSDDPATAAMVKSRAIQAATGINSGTLAVTTTWTPSNTQGSTVHVQVQYAFYPITPLVPATKINLVSDSERVILY